MLMTTDTKRIHQSYEDAREREAEGTEPEVACQEREAELDEDHAHSLEGITYCAGCALHRAATLFHDLEKLWPKRTAAFRLEALEVMGAAAGELESELRRQVRAGKAA